MHITKTLKDFVFSSLYPNALLTIVALAHSNRPTNPQSLNAEYECENMNEYDTLPWNSQGLSCDLRKANFYLLLISSPFFWYWTELFRVNETPTSAKNSNFQIIDWVFSLSPNYKYLTTKKNINKKWLLDLNSVVMGETYSVKIF